MEDMFPYATVSHVVSSAGFVLTTWLAAYLTVHVSRNSPARLAILSLFALSGYFLHTVLCVFVPADQIGHLWRRYMGWLASHSCRSTNVHTGDLALGWHMPRRSS